jgi:hypothetical protein
MLASIARHAVLEPIRQAAFDELHDRSDILTVALNGEFKDTATAAVNRPSAFISKTISISATTAPSS